MVPFKHSIRYPGVFLQGERGLLRDTLHDGLREARETGDDRTVAMITLIETALKERDICARQSGLGSEISDGAIQSMIQDMVTQRHDDMVRAEQSGRLERAEQERQEIAILERFLPKKMSHEEMAGAVEHVIDDLGATGLKDTGKVMAQLKEKFGGSINPLSAKRLVCDRLRQ